MGERNERLARIERQEWLVGKERHIRNSYFSSFDGTELSK